MCSIIGFVDSQKRDVGEAIGMLDRTRHRGPDAAGLYLDGVVERMGDLSQLARVRGSARICLGHSRLEIVGGSAGVQPLKSCDGRLALIHNGEIYNYRELRTLIADHKIQTGSDSEVLVHLVEEFYRGDLVEAVRRVMPLLDGMYAFAVTDRERVVVVRDPIGKKPVYYVEGFPLYFASEPKALRELDRAILRLHPGQILSVSPGESKVLSGYAIERPPISITDMEEAVHLYGEAFDRAIQKRVRGLDRVAVLFSGGVDSTLVAQFIQEHGVEVTGYCVGMKTSTDIQHALRAAEEMKIPLKTSFLTEKVVEGVLPGVIEAIELNGIVQVEAAIPMYIAAQMAAEDGHRIMFTGQGADELFAGYAWYPEVVAQHGYLTLHERLWDDIHHLYLDTLEREDRMTMAHSLELRAPFLDRHLIHVAMQISPNLKVAGPGDSFCKRVHRELATRKGVPQSIAWREKVPAQDGCAITDILQPIAERHFNGQEVPAVEVTDYGSNYRYLRDDLFGTPETVAYLADFAKRHRIHIYPDPEHV